MSAVFLETCMHLKTAFNFGWQSLFNLMKPVDIDIVLNGCDYRKMVEFGVDDGKRERHYLYYDGEAVSGKVKSVFLSNRRVS